MQLLRDNLTLWTSDLNEVQRDAEADKIWLQNNRTIYW
jgi:hypothetical protein